MALKQAPTYATKGKSKFVAPSRCLIIQDNDEYIPPATRTSPTAPRTSQNTAQLVSSNEVTAPSLRSGPYRSAHRLSLSRSLAKANDQIYTDARMLNEHEKMARLVIDKRHILTSSLHIAPVIDELFRRHRYEWIAWSSESRGDSLRVLCFQMESLAALRFATKFCWLLVRNRVSPTLADNVVTEDRAVMLAAMIVGLEIDFACIYIAKIHEKAFRAATTLPFPSLIFLQCRDSSVQVWDCHMLLNAAKTLDIGLIRDNATVAAPCRESQALPSSATSQAPNSSQATPLSASTLVPLAQVLKLETQMVTLHIRPWMQRSIEQSEGAYSKFRRAKGPLGVSPSTLGEPSGAKGKGRANTRANTRRDDEDNREEEVPPQVPNQAPH
ncbi:hypothetical protein MTR67_026628 [Solanum verrucosum]|uniref:Putative plant transposon protein domain-containing protein n=1 Tax=Solanum verrucosum TaxID=315347 RepID=A0AAF0R380_SOLVR|nr:hypothetical protein MTR67_026628 [Solanum verrucosum]